MHRGWWAVQGTFCVTGLHNESGEALWAADAWALRSLTTG